MTTVTPATETQTPDAFMIPTLAEIEEAAKGLAPVISHTPVLPSHTLSDLLGSPVLLKMENLQRTGSFKVRGATHRLSRLTPEERAGEFAAPKFLNHEWDNPAAMRKVGDLTLEDTRELTGGLFEMEVPVNINAKLFDYDQLVILGPVFPHEVVVRSNDKHLDFNHCSASLGDISLNQIAYGADVDVLITQLQRTHFVFVVALGDQFVPPRRLDIDVAGRTFQRAAALRLDGQAVVADDFHDAPAFERGQAVLFAVTVST